MKASVFLGSAVAAGVSLGLFTWVWTARHLASPPNVPSARAGGGDGGEKGEYLDSLAYFAAERAYPGKSIDWSMYRRAALDAAEAPQLAPPAGPKWKFLGPNNLDSPPGATYQGPSPLAGRVNCVAYGAGNTIYAGSATGGFYKGTYGSGDWTELSNSSWPTYACSCCAVDPTGQIIYVGTGDFQGLRPNPPGAMGIMESFDGGATWSNVDVFGNVAVSRIAVDADNGVVLATTGRSSAGGIDVTLNYQTLGRLWISTDQGDTWGVAAGTPAAVWSACAISRRSATTGLRYYYAVCWIPGTGGQLWRSDDQGATWHQTRNPFVNMTQYSLDVACSPTNSDAVYVLSGGGPLGGSIFGDRAILQSLNGGNTWTNITNSGNAKGFPNDGNAGGAGYIWSQYYYNYTLAVTSRPTAAGGLSDWVFVGLIDLASAVPNGVGTEWTWQGHSYDTGAGMARTHNDDHALAFNPSNPNQALFANDGGVYGMTLNAGGAAAFTPLNKSLWVSEFYNMAFMPNEAPGKQSYYVGGGQDIAGPNFKSGKAGPTSHWNNAVNLGDGGYAAIDPANSANQFLAGYFNSAPGGGAPPFVSCYSTANTWTTVKNIANRVLMGDRGAFLPPLIRSKATGSLFMGMNHVWRYKGGAWGIYFGPTQPVRQIGGAASPTDYVRALAVDSGEKYLYTGSLEGSVWMNDPVGKWVELDQAGGNAGTVGLPQRSVTSVAIDPQSNTRIWVTLSGPSGVARVWRCDDVTAGAKRTWAPITIRVGTRVVDIPACCIAINPKNRNQLYVGTDMGVYYSGDAGRTWFDATAPYGLPVVSVRAIDFTTVGGTNYLSIATFGRGSWEIYPPPSGGPLRGPASYPTP